MQREKNKIAGTGCRHEKRGTEMNTGREGMMDDRGIALHAERRRRDGKPFCLKRSEFQGHFSVSSKY
jgi:hypothetical protein